MNNLVESVKGEVGALQELWLWSQHFPDDLRRAIHKAAQEFLNLTIQQGWEKPRTEPDTTPPRRG